MKVTQIRIEDPLFTVSAAEGDIGVKVEQGILINRNNGGANVIFGKGESLRKLKEMVYALEIASKVAACDDLRFADFEAQS